MKWIEVSVQVLSSQVDLATDYLLRFSPQGFWDSPARRGQRVLRAYVPATAGGRAAIRGLRRMLAHALSAKSVQTRSVHDTDWVGAWKAVARRIRIGRLIVQPTWMNDDASGRVVIRVDPGMAFGSGEHPSTRLCLRAIERHLRPGSTMFDVGTGSGVLAIAAARLGAGKVIAIDSDPVAIDVARANVRANGVARRVKVLRGQGLARAHVRADLIAANLTADALPPVLSDVRRCLVPGGRFVASGFGATHLSDLRRQFAGAGLSVTATERLRGWYAVHATRARAH